jgi:hypothetical protein
MNPEMTTALTLDSLLEEFRESVYGNPNLDPDDIYHWDSLAFGWAIAKGADVELATDVSIHWLL